MKVYIQTDIEGVSGVVHWWNHEMWLNYSQDPLEIFELRKRMRQLLTGEVNAAIAGCLDAGADEIVVNDSHGWGYNIFFEQLNPKATIIHGEYDALPFWLPQIEKNWDAVVVVGGHPMAGTKDGVLAHSKSIWNDNLALGEVGNCALLFGALDVPMVFASGDTMLKREIEQIVPQIEFAVVKESLSTNVARSLHPSLAQEKIRTGVAQGLARRKEVKPFKIKCPCTLIKRIVDKRDEKDIVLKGPNPIEVFKQLGNWTEYPPCP